MLLTILLAISYQQQVVSLGGNIFTGGLEEAVFAIHLGKVLDPPYRLGLHQLVRLDIEVF